MTIGGTTSTCSHCSLKTLDAFQDFYEKGSDGWWYSFLVIAYQYTANHDRDPTTNDYLPSVTSRGLISNPIFNNFSRVFIETIREEALALPIFSDPIPYIQKMLSRDIAHEIRHAAGAVCADGDHPEGGLMAQTPEGDVFTSVTIYRLRQRYFWQTSMPH
jgi:hypothetical protein